MELKEFIRDIPDFPKKGIIFKDITPLLSDNSALKETVKQLVELYRDKGITKVAAMESRGFIFAVPVALELGVGFVPLRKPGKLPYKTVSETYTLEYGTDTLEMHEDAVSKGDRVLILDDLLATGGTAEGAARLVEKCGAEVASFAFVIELGFLEGRNKLGKHDVQALIKY